MSTLSQFFDRSSGEIKSIQRGVITISANPTVTATISSVDTSKSILYLLGYSTATDNTLQDKGINRMAYLTLTDSTTITASGAVQPINYYGVLYVSWQLVEYY